MATTNSTGQLADELAKQATAAGRAMGDAVGKKAEDIADKSKMAGADAVASVARTAESIADTVAKESPMIADYVRGAGAKIDRLASDLRDKKAGELLSSAVEFGRAQPAVLLAGAALVGFALARLIKAGAVAVPKVEAPVDGFAPDGFARVDSFASTRV